MGPRALSGINRVLLFVALTAPVPVACTIERGDVRTPSGRAPEADSTSVRLVAEAVARAFESGDIATVDSLFGDSLTVFHWDQVTTGRASYVDYLESQVGALDDRRVRLQDITVKLARNSAWATYGFTCEGTRNGEPIEVRGVGTMILQRSQSRWQIVHIHTSVTHGDDAR
jgi:ketosteroid isomerase-like protein